MIFNPSLDYGVADGFYDVVEMLISDAYKMASLVSRLAEHNGQEHYQVNFVFYFCIGNLLVSLSCQPLQIIQFFY